MLNLAFHGAAETVTGSKYLLNNGKSQVLIDCGLFQGLKQIRERNWARPAFDEVHVDAVVLTHAHLDHVGYLPRLVRDGFKGPIYCTPATRELARLILLDSAVNQERDAEYANERHFTRHSPALPLYTEEDVHATLRLFKDVPRKTWQQAAHGIHFRYHEVGHLLGSSWIEVRAEHSGGETRLCFSGDVGRYRAPYYHDPSPPLPCDYLICESTYGDRDHAAESPLDQLAGITERALERGGVMVFASFAVGRAQQLVYLFRSLMECKRLPPLEIYVDSPMAVDATRIFANHLEDHELGEQCSNDATSPFVSKQIHYAKSVQDSKRINAVESHAVIISSSGMMEGGRILHHLRQRLPDERNTIVMGGYMAEGTRGRDMQNGAERIRIHGRDVPVRAAIESAAALSGHADRSELFRWTAPLPPPKQVFLTHGELTSAQALAASWQAQRGWKCVIPKHEEVFELD